MPDVILSSLYEITTYLIDVKVFGQTHTGTWFPDLVRRSSIKLNIDLNDESESNLHQSDFVIIYVY